MSRRRRCHQRQIEQRLSRRLPDGTDEMPVQGKLPARVHLFQLRHDRVESVHKYSCSRSSILTICVSGD
jgi:hypothetical protein